MFALLQVLVDDEFQQVRARPPLLLGFRVQSLYQFFEKSKREVFLCHGRIVADCALVCNCTCNAMGTVVG